MGRIIGRKTRRIIGKRENINRNIKYPDIFQKFSHFSAYVQALTSI